MKGTVVAFYFIFSYSCEMLASVARPAGADFIPFLNLADESATGDLDIMAEWSFNASNDTLSPLILAEVQQRQTLRTTLQFMSVICFVFYAYVVFVIAKHLKVTLNNPFYAYVISLAVSDFLILVYVAARLPEREAFLKPPWFWVVPFLVQLSWYGNLFNVLGLTCTRFVAVVLHQNAKNVSESESIL